MATVERIEQSFAQHKVVTIDIERQDKLTPLLVQYQQQRKWMYVLSDNLSVQQPLEHCIAMKKPEPELLISWLKKLIKCGQAGCILVQNLSVAESEYRVLKMLCVLYKVTLINLRQSEQQNLVFGPW